MTADCGRLVQAARDEPPGLAIVGHVVIPVAVEATVGELLVDEREHGNPGLGVLGEHVVAERGQCRRLGLGEEPPRGHVVDPVEDDAPGEVVPGAAPATTS